MNVIQSVAIAEGLNPTIQGECLLISQIGLYEFQAASLATRDGKTVLYVNGNTNPVTAGRYVSVFQMTSHHEFDGLAHNLREPRYEKYTYTGNLVTAIVSWDSSAMDYAIREINYTYDGNKIDNEFIYQYDFAGNIIESLQGVYTYDGNKVDFIEWSYI